MDFMDRIDTGEETTAVRNHDSIIKEAQSKGSNSLETTQRSPKINMLKSP